MPPRSCARCTPRWASSAPSPIRNPPAVTTPCFPLGQLLATPGALQDLEEARLPATYLLQRHVRGDWGQIHPDDRGQNEAALEHGSRLFSVYVLPTGKRLWVITEADRSATTILRPEDY